MLEHDQNLLDVASVLGNVNNDGLIYIIVLFATIVGLLIIYQKPIIAYLKNDLSDMKKRKFKWYDYLGMGIFYTICLAIIILGFTLSFSAGLSAAIEAGALAGFFLFACTLFICFMVGVTFGAFLGMLAACSGGF